MNNKIKIVCALLVTMLFQTTAFSEEEIVVKLATESHRLPIVIEPIQAESSDFPKEHLQALLDVFSFDMNANGMTQVIAPKDKKRFQLLQGSFGFDKAPDFAKCKEADIFYLIKSKMEGKSLAVKMIAINGQSVKLIEGISCTGDLAKDRKTMHHLADSIHEMLFQKPGIASQRIIFTLKNGAESAKAANKFVSEVFEADYDGANEKQLTNENAFCVTPLFVPSTNGAKSPCLVFVSYKIGQPKIYFALAKDGKPRRLTTIKGNQMTPQVSRDGTKIAFACDATGSSDLFLQTFHPSTGALSKPRQIFAAKGAAQASPTFSPDGKQIAFVSNKDGTPKIYVMDIPPEGATSKDLHPKLISKRCRENSAPAWSPDGTKIAYSAKSSGNRQIWIYDFETHEERQLTSGKGDKENPAWAPNSLHLLFNAIDDKKTELYLINLNQSEAFKITSGDGEKRFPCWK